MAYEGKIGPGKIIFYAAHKPKIFSTDYREVFNRLQKIFTRKKWTHVSNGFIPFKNYENVSTIFESNELQNVTLWKKNTKAEYEIYEIKWYTQEEIEQALWEAFNEYNGEMYGFIQLLYFLRRWIWETKWIKKLFWWIPTKVFGKPDDVRQWNNWSVGGTICSELFNKIMRKLNRIRYNEDVQKQIDIWNENNFHAGDAHDFVTALPEIFELVYHKEGGQY